MSNSSAGNLRVYLEPFRKLRWTYCFYVLPTHSHASGIFHLKHQKLLTTIKWTLQKIYLMVIFPFISLIYIKLKKKVALKLDREWLRIGLKKSRIRKTKHLSTDADSSTDTAVRWSRIPQNPIFLKNRKNHPFKECPMVWTPLPPLVMRNHF